MLFYGDLDLTGLRLACHSLPMFHGMGLSLIIWTVSSIWLVTCTISRLCQAATGLVLTVFRPQIPAQMPTADAVIEGSFHTESDIIFSVPSFLEVRRWFMIRRCII